MRFRVNDYTLETTKLNRNIKLLSISDIHYNRDLLDYLLKSLEILSPDIICIPGDLLDKTNDDMKEIITWLKEISSTYKTFLSLGNHDLVRFEKNGNNPWSISLNFDFFKEVDKISNVVYLRGLFETHRFNDLTISALNMPALWYENRENRESKDEFERVLRGIDYSSLEKSALNILLSHSPNGFIENNILVSSNRYEILKYFDLILSGHNHGGLVPSFIQPFIKNNRGIVGPYLKAFPESSFGSWTSDETSLILSDGISKCADSSEVKYLKRIINAIYPPDIEQINIESGFSHKLTINKTKTIKIK